MRAIKRPVKPPIGAKPARSSVARRGVTAWHDSAAMTDYEPRTLTLTDFADDPRSVLRFELPPDADAPLLLAARETAHDVLAQIMEAERRPALHPDTASLLESARMSVIGANCHDRQLAWTD